MASIYVHQQEVHLTRDSTGRYRFPKNVTGGVCETCGRNLAYLGTEKTIEGDHWIVCDESRRWYGKTGCGRLYAILDWTAEPSVETTEWTDEEIDAIAVGTRRALGWPQDEIDDPISPETRQKLRGLLFRGQATGSDRYDSAARDVAKKFLVEYRLSLPKIAQTTAPSQSPLHRYREGASSAVPWWSYHGYQSEDEELRTLGLAETPDPATGRICVSGQEVPLALRDGENVVPANARVPCEECQMPLSVTGIYEDGHMTCARQFNGCGHLYSVEWGRGR